MKLSLSSFTVRVSTSSRRLHFLFVFLSLCSNVVAPVDLVSVFSFFLSFFLSSILCFLFFFIFSFPLFLTPTFVPFSLSHPPFPLIFIFTHTNTHNRTISDRHCSLYLFCFLSLSPSFSPFPTSSLCFGGVLNLCARFKNQFNYNFYL